MTDQTTSNDPTCILIVEDQGLIALRLERMLTRLGYQVTGAVPDGYAALQSLERSPPDLVLMDINLEDEMDGVETATRIRARCDVPIVYLTAYAEHMVMDEIKDTHPYGFLAKPVRDRELDATIELALYKHRMEAKLRQRQRLLSKAEEMAHIGSWEWDIERDIFTVSAGWQRVHGCAASQLSRQELLPIAHPDDRARIERALAQALEHHQPYEIQHRIVRQDNGEVRVVQAYGEVVCDGEMPVKMYGTAQDITDRVQAEAERDATLEKLRESEERFRLIAETSSDILFQLDLEGWITYCSPAVKRVLGLTPDQIVGTHLRRYFRPGGLDQALQNFARAKQAEQVEIVDAGVVNHAGETVLVEATLAPVLQNGEVIAVQGAARDVTERRQTQEALERIEWMLTKSVEPGPSSTDEYTPPYPDITALNTHGEILDAVGKATLVRIAQDAIDLLDTSVAVYEANGDYACGLFSSAWCQYMDSASYALCGDGDLRTALRCGKWLCHECCWNESAQAAMASGQETDIACVGGIHLYAVPIFAHDEVVGVINIGYGTPPTDETSCAALAERFGVSTAELQKRAQAYEPRPPYIVALAKKQLHTAAALIGEIVERKRTEGRLRNANQQLSLLFDALPVGISVLDRERTVLKQNQALTEILDMPSADLSEGRYRRRQYLRADRSPMPVEEFPSSRVIDGEGAVRDVEIGIVKEDGDLIWTNVSAVGCALGDWRALLVTSDITARKQAEEALHESEAFLQTVYDHSPVGIYVVDVIDKASYRYRGVNSAHEQLLGVADHTVRGKSPLALAEEYGQDAVDYILDLYDTCVQQRQPMAFEEQVTWGDKTVSLLSQLTPLLDDQGEVYRLIGTTLDITERVRAEEALRESETRLRAIGDNLPAGQIYQLRVEADGTSRFTYVSAAVEKLHECTIQEALDDPTVLFDRVVKEDIPAWQQAIEKATREMSLYDHTLRIRRNSGEIRWHRMIAKPRNAQDGAILFDGIDMDITEQVRAEEALRESATRFRTIINALPQFVAYNDKDLIYRFVNQTYQEKFDIAPHEIIGKTLPEVIGETAFEEARPHIDRVLQGQQVRYHERYAYAIGGTRDIDGILVPDVGEDGQVRGYYAVLTDITPYIEMQEALKQTTERLQILHDIDSEILHARSPRSIARAALEHLHDLIPYQLASVSEIDLDQQRGRSVIVLDQNGPVETRMSDWHPLQDGAAIIEMARQGQAHLLQDLSALEIFSPLEKHLHNIGARSYISAPLMVQDELVGTLNLAAAEPNAFQPDHVEIMHQIAASLAVAMQQAGLLAQTQQDAASKALLLREVNHRVMNNLTMILSILELEMAQPRTPAQAQALRAVLQDIGDRIQGIATVHHMLSNAQSDSLDPGQLADKVIHAALSSAPIQCPVAMDAAPELPRVSSKQAVTLALVLNELTTNSVKYAFVDRAAGQIGVRIEHAAGENGAPRVRLVYRDDGPGWPDAVLDGERDSTGLWLIEASVTHNLGGEIAWYNDGGAVAEIQFPVRASGSYLRR